jgi:hypothetical protein
MPLKSKASEACFWHVARNVQKHANMVDASDVRSLRGRVGRFHYFIGVAQGGALPCIWMDVLFLQKHRNAYAPDEIAQPLKKW